MSNLTSTIGGCYTLHTFETLSGLWQQMAQSIGSSICCVSNAELPDPSSLASQELANTSVGVVENLPRFLLLYSERFQALLVGTIVRESEPEQIEIEITFLATAIERFLKPLILNFPIAVPLISDRSFVNDRYLEHHFAQMSASVLALADSQKSARVSLSPDLHLVTSLATEDRKPASIAFDRREIELQQQVAQANLLNHIITQIHQTFDLSATLQSAVEQVQTFLHADRLIIYQFEFDKKANTKDFDAAGGRGKVAYESIGTTNLQSVLNVSEREDCFNDRQLWQQYRDGMTKSTIMSIENMLPIDVCWI
jgi:two-component system, sensor histidine kinase and response regulator